MVFRPASAAPGCVCCAPDDAADLIQVAPASEREGLLALLDEPTRNEVNGLLAYAEDQAGGLMNPRYAHLRPEMSVDEAVSYLRRHAREHLATLYYAYVLDQDQKLLGVVSLRDLFRAKPDQHVGDVMRTTVITIPGHMDQETVSRYLHLLQPRRHSGRRQAKAA